MDSMLELDLFIENVVKKNYEYGDAKLLHKLNVTWAINLKDGTLNDYILAISEGDSNCCKCYAIKVATKGLELLDEIDISQCAPLEDPYVLGGFIVAVLDGNNERIATFSEPWGKFINEKQVFNCEKVSLIDETNGYSLWLMEDEDRLVFIDPWGCFLDFNIPLEALTSASTVVSIDDWRNSSSFVHGYSLFFIGDNLRYVWYREERTGVNFPANSLFEFADVNNALFDIEGKYAISQNKGKLFCLADGRAWNCPTLTKQARRFHQKGTIKVNERLNLLSVKGYKRPLEVHEIGKPIEIK